MSLLVVVSVFDTAVQSFGRPIFVPAIGAAMRSFADEVNRSAADNQMYAHADDFELWYLSTFDEESGEFVDGTKRLLARGKDVKNDAQK